MIAVLTFATAGTLLLMLVTTRPKGQGGWSWRSPQWLDSRIILHHRAILLAHDEVLAGQAPDTEFEAKVSQRFREARKAGELTSSPGIMEDSFVRRRFLGIGWGQGEFLDRLGLRTRCDVLLVPLWMLLVLLAAYPTIAFIRGPMRRMRRRRKGLCVKCGYDLTGNVSGVCPECGQGI